MSYLDLPTWCKRRGTLSKEYGRDDFDSEADWISKLDAHVQLIAIINGPSHKSGGPLPPGSARESQYKKFLNLGFHIAPVADQDNHFRTWGTITNARTAVICSAPVRVHSCGKALPARTWSLDSHCPKTRYESSRIHSEELGCAPGAGDLPARSVQHRQDVIALELLQLSVAEEAHFCFGLFARRPSSRPSGRYLDSQLASACSD